MSITDSQKIDFLWKKTIYNVTDTAGSAKAGYEETIASNTAVFGNAIMAETIPVPAPGIATSVVNLFTTGTALKMTVDPTTTGQQAWVATSTFGNLATRISNWIAPAIDAGYLVEIYKNDATVPANKLLGGTTGFEWVFDYSAGVLRFVNAVPLVASDKLYIVGYNYVGKTGLGGAGVNLKETAVTYTGNSITTGTYQLLNYFDFTPQGGSIGIEVNGMRLEPNMFSTSGRNLTLNIDNMPYQLDSGDIISGRYTWAA